jgi:hypothetical protein
VTTRHHNRVRVATEHPPQPGRLEDTVENRRYAFRVEGALSADERSALVGTHIEDVRPGLILTKTVLDEAELFGILAQLAHLGLHLVSMEPLPD